MQELVLLVVMAVVEMVAVDHIQEVLLLIQMEQIIQEEVPEVQMVEVQVVQPKMVVQEL